MTKPMVINCFCVGDPPEPFENWTQFFENMWETKCLRGVEIKARKWSEQAMRPTQEQNVSNL